MKVGIVILNYNDSDTTCKLVKKIQHYDSIYKIQIVDNCSTDKSYSILSKLVGNKINLIKTKKNAGYSYGNNCGARILINDGCDIIIIANPDVEFTNEYINKCINFFFKPNVGMVAGKIQDISGLEPNKWDYMFENYKYDLMYCSTLYRKFNKMRSSYQIKDIQKVDKLPGSLFAISSKAFIDIGGFDENVFLYCEERILGYKLKENGYDIILDGNNCYLHNHSTTINKTFNRSQKIKILFESKKYVYSTYCKVSKFKQKVLLLAMKFSYFEFYTIDRLNKFMSEFTKK